MSMDEKIYNFETFIVGDTLIEVWEGKTGWKWQVSSASGENEGNYPTHSFGCLGQTEGLLKALAWLSRHTLASMSVEDEETYVALYPGLEYHKTHRSEKVIRVRLSEYQPDPKYLKTFVDGRKVYDSDDEWYKAGDYWRGFWLSAGEVGDDEKGHYQIFTISQKSGELLNKNED